jgi:hypothetical protein
VGGVPPLDPREQIAPGFGAGGVRAVVDALDLQRVEEALHGRVVEAASLAAHLWRDPGGGERLPVRLARILDAPIRMTDRAGSRALPPDGHLEGFHRDPGRAASRASPSRRSCGCARLEDRGQVRHGAAIGPRPMADASPRPCARRACPREGGGQVAEPDPGSGPGQALVGPRRLEAAPDPVGSDGVPMPAVGGAHAARQGRQAPQARPAPSGRATRWRPTRRPRTCRAACTRGAPQLPPLAGRGPRGCRREAPGWPGSSRFRAGHATHRTR